MSSIALCIPAYNAAWCLPKLLESAKEQSIPFDEIIVYNDCSTDNTKELALQYGALVIDGDTNRGCSYGKNSMAKVAKSKWIHFHDSDDLLLPNFTSLAHQWFKKQHQPDIILLNFEYKDYNTGKFLGSPSYDRVKLIADAKKFVLENKIVNFALCKKESFLKIGGFDLDPNVLYNEDRAFYVRAAIAELDFDYDPHVTSINFRYTDSMSASNELKCAAAYYSVSKKAAKALGDKYPREIAVGLWDNATIAASHQDWKLVQENIDLATKLNGNIPIGQNSLVRLISIISPKFAYLFREKMIRLFKPKLRVNG